MRIFTDELASALHLPAERLHVGEVSSSGAFLLIDLVGTGSEAAAARSLRLFSQSADALASLPTYPLERRFGVLRQAAEPEEEATQLLPVVQEDDKGSSMEHQALVITLLFIVGAMVVACCCPLLRTVCHQLQLSRTHSRVSTVEYGTADLTADLDGQDGM